MSTISRRWGRIAQVAENEGVTDKTVRRWIAAGLIYAERIGPRVIRVDLDSVERAGRPIGGDVIADADAVA
ncbi:hypothetical protein [Agromyces sp. NPDC057865]|uniref:hypothetical protein n=1 Tax=Agromyces sp. NPDC057865 TaxID=3346267 RepID=UPI0036724330